MEFMYGRILLDTRAVYDRSVEEGTPTLRTLKVLHTGNAFLQIPTLSLMKQEDIDAVHLAVTWSLPIRVYAEHVTGLSMMPAHKKTQICRVNV